MQKENIQFSGGESLVDRRKKPNKKIGKLRLIINLSVAVALFLGITYQ